MNNIIGNINIEGYGDLITVTSPQNSNSYFNSILNAISEKYKMSLDNKLILNRDEFVVNFRKNLATKLENNIPNNDNYHEANITYYEHIFSETDIKLDIIRKIIENSVPIDDLLEYINQYVSEIIDKNIYIINSETKEILNNNFRFPNIKSERDSIILILKYIEIDNNIYYHYDLATVRSSVGHSKTIFSNNNDIILFLNN